MKTKAEWGFVCALQMEAATLVASARRRRCVTVGRIGKLVLCGMGAIRARQAALLLADDGADVLVSWGVAGALDPALESGQLLFPATVSAAGDVEYSVDPDLRALFLSTQTTVHSASDKALFCAETAIVDRVGKQRLFARSGAAAVDLESAAVAAVAAERGLPFVAVRSVLDTAGTRLPAFVSSAVDPFGRVRWLNFCAALLRHPGDLMALLPLARQSHLARDALASLARKLPALLAASDQGSHLSVLAGSESAAGDSR
ncbi:MAG: hypothetical protein RQ899_02465 [Pseudomonadales bacterium]|nr:hypothetical protein [Pseudomonadales bacterium]